MSKMSKTLKLLLLIPLIFLILVIIAIVALPKLVDTEAFREQITEQVKEQTGQDLLIDGELSLSVFPWLGVRTDGITLSQPPNLTKETDKPLLSVDSADIKVKLFSLLVRAPEIDTILLKQPRIYYLINREGSTSLDGLINEKAGREHNNKTSETRSEPNHSDSGAALAAIVIAGISITEGELTYENKQTGEKHQVKNFSLTTGNLLSGQAAPVSLTGDILPDKAERIAISLETSAAIQIESKAVELSDLNLSVSQQNTASVKSSIKSLQFQQNTQQLAIRDMTLNGEHKTFKPQLSIPAIDVDLANAKTSTINFTLVEDKLGINTQGQLMLKDWNNMVAWQGDLSIAPFSPRKIIETLAIDYAPTDASALESLALKSRFSGGSNGLALNHIDIKLDDSQLNGDLTLVNFADPAYRFDITLDQINIDRYLPLVPESETQNKEPANASLAIAAPIPIFKQINANGTFRANQLTANGVSLSDIVVDIVSKNKQVVITPRAKLYDGTFNGKITFKDLGDRSTLSVKKNFSGVKFGSLLTDAGITDQLSGLGSIDADVFIEDVNGKQTNTGTISLSAQDGAIKGIDIKKILDDTRNKFNSLRGKEVSSSSGSESDETRFTAMTATLNMVNNTLRNDDLNIKAPAFRIGGKGGINLIEQTLDYITSVVVVGSSEGQGGKNRDQLKGLEIPIRFHGDLSAPKVDVDVKTILKANTQRDIDRKRNQLKENAAKKLGIAEDNPDKDLDNAAKEQIKEKLQKKKEELLKKWLK